MTDKERLEEIINDITFVAKSYNGVEPLIEYAKVQVKRVERMRKEFAEDIDFEKMKNRELTERVSELEDAIEYQVESSNIDLGNLLEYYKVIKEQNKRYREYLNQIKDNMIDDINNEVDTSPQFIKNICDEALRDESNE